MVDLNESPGVWHGIAEGQVWLSDKERLELALKACDLYLKRVEELEQERDQIVYEAEAGRDL